MNIYRIKRKVRQAVIDLVEMTSVMSCAAFVCYYNRAHFESFESCVGSLLDVISCLVTIRSTSSVLAMPSLTGTFILTE